MISRRDFLNKALGAAGATAILSSCTINEKQIHGKLLGPNAALGHRLRTMDFEPPKKTSSVPVLIVGGGVSGLSAAWYLKKNNIDFTLLELENLPGGNSIGGSNSVSTYPWGAHYLPLPNVSYQPLIDFLEEANVIMGWKNGLPVFNEYHLCFDPKERLFIHDHWQEGLLPVHGVPAADQNEIHRFNELMEKYKSKKGSDGREAFSIPMEMSSDDPELRKLDLISMRVFLQQHDFRSAYLLWYVSYCCADDYGASLENVSAWAGIHYFASRKGRAFNASADTMLTWPEGNAWLVNKLKHNFNEHIVSARLAYHVENAGNKVHVKVLDANTNTTEQIIADQVIMATPQFVNERLLPDQSRKINLKSFDYSPWMVANISLNSTLQEKRGEELCWDNVIYGSASMGYVNATHQRVDRYVTDKVITYYKPLTGSDARAERQKVFSASFDDWIKMILSDLKGPHPKLTDAITNVDIWRWGHGMIRPSPGFITGADRRAAATSVGSRIHFAHSDLSGISIFEEAFYRGIEAAKKITGNG